MKGRTDKDKLIEFIEESFGDVIEQATRDCKGAFDVNRYNWGGEIPAIKEIEDTFVDLKNDLVKEIKKMNIKDLSGEIDHKFSTGRLYVLLNNENGCWEFNIGIEIEFAKYMDI